MGGERDPDQVWEEVWAQLARASRDHRHAFRHPVIATRSARFTVSARTVVLRAAVAAQARLDFFTDRRSAKLEGLGIEPSVGWCFYDPRRRVQVRAETRAVLHEGDEVARSAWSRQGDAARALYAPGPAPGTPLEDDAGCGKVDGDVGFGNFVVAHCDVVELDWLWLAKEGHRRIRFAREPDGHWAGVPVVP